MQWDLELQVCLLAKSWFTLANWVSVKRALHTGTQASSSALSWNLHIHQWRWIMLMRPDFLAVLTGQSFFSLMQDICFLVKCMLINESSLGQRNAKPGKAFNFTDM